MNSVDDDSEKGNLNCLLKNALVAFFNLAKRRASSLRLAKPWLESHGFDVASMRRAARRVNQRAVKERTKRFAVRVVRLYSALPKEAAAQVIGKQLLRSGTSVGAHYRESQRSRSSAEFISKIEVGLQELEETDYWVDLLIECNLVPSTTLLHSNKKFKSY